MTTAKLPGIADQTRHPQLVNDGTLGLQSSGQSGPTQHDSTSKQLAEHQPVGSYVRFGRVGGRSVFWETSNGKLSKPSVKYGDNPQSRDYYQEGDFFNEGEMETRELKKLFPDAGIESKEFDFWNVLESLAGTYEANKLQLVRRIDKISIDETNPWSGTIHTSYYVVVENSLLPLAGRNTEQKLTARPGDGSLNEHFGRAPILAHMQFLQTVISSEVAIVTELAQDALIGAATKGVKAIKVVQKLAKSKRALRAAKLLKNLDKRINSSMLAKATLAFAKAFASTLAADAAKYTLAQLAGKEEKLPLGLKQDTGQVSFEEGSSISPKKSESQYKFGKAYVPLNKTPTFNFSNAIIQGSAAFAHSLLVVDGLAEPISEAIGKKVADAKIGAIVASQVKTFVSNLGTTFFSNAIATAANNAMNDPAKQSSYPKHLAEALRQNLINYFTTDFVKGVLKNAAFGFED